METEAPKVDGLLEITHLGRYRAGLVPRSDEVQGPQLLSCSGVVWSQVSWWWQQCLLLVTVMPSKDGESRERADWNGTARLPYMPLEQWLSNSGSPPPTPR